MEAKGEVFYIDYRGQQVAARAAEHNGRTLYQVKLPHRRIFITQATAIKGAGTFWTSIPQGDQELAEELGEQIERRTKTQQQNLF